MDIILAGILALAAGLVLGYPLWLALRKETVRRLSKNSLLDVTAMCRPRGQGCNKAGNVQFQHPAGGPDHLSDDLALPCIDVVVPVFNEADWIVDKLENLAALDYPPDRIRFWIIDGASTDATVAKVSPWIAGRPNYKLVSAGHADKVSQLNAGLLHARSDWILVTDADARLPANALKKMLASARADRATGVVGASVEPVGAHPAEALHWRIANRLRDAEACRASASIVTGPCYLFRRSLFHHFPSGVIADDIYTAFAAAAQGGRVIMSNVSVYELRSPLGLIDMYHHKLRKAHAYLREIFRFLPRVGQMPAPVGGMFLWRALQLTLIPLLGLALATIVIGNVVFYEHAYVGEALVIACSLPVWAVMLTGQRDRSSILWSVPLAALILLVLISALVRYPFSRQTACYPKVSHSYLSGPGPEEALQHEGN